MATNAQYLAANLANHYNFKQQQFNNILKYLVSQESITPGASTALIEDIQRQQSALKERRLALSRLRQSGLLADKELIVELEKIKGDLKEVTARGITDVATAKAQLQKVFTDELRDEEAQGRSQFGSATTTSQARKAAELQVVGVNAPKSDLVDSVQNYYDDHIRARHEALGKDSVAYAQFNQQLKQHLQDIAEQRATITKTPAQGVADEVLNRLGINSAETPDQAKQRVSDAFQKEVISPLRPGRAAPDTTARAIALGMSEESLKEIFKGDVYVDSPDARKFARAAYFSRYLPQNLDENLQPRLGGEGLTEAEFLAKLQAGDEEASRLYNMVLQREPSEVALLSEGQYPYELYQITRAERGLDKRRGELGAALSPTRRQRGYEALYQEARSIYNNLFRGGGVRDPGARQANRQRLERGGPELQAAVKEVGRAEDTQYIGDLPVEEKQAIADQSDGTIVVENEEMVDTNTGEQVTTLAGLVSTTAGPEAAQAVAAQATQMTNAQAKQIARSAASVSAQPDSMAYGAAMERMRNFALPAAGQAFGGGLPTLAQPAAPAPAPMTRQPLSIEQQQDLAIMGREPTGPIAQPLPDPIAVQKAAFGAGVTQGQAIQGEIARGGFLAPDASGLTNEDMIEAAEDAWRQSATYTKFSASELSALKELGEISRGGFNEKNIDNILGNKSANPQAKQSAAAFAKIHSGD